MGSARRCQATSGPQGTRPRSGGHRRRCVSSWSRDHPKPELRARIIPSGPIGKIELVEDAAHVVADGLRAQVQEARTPESVGWDSIPFSPGMRRSMRVTVW